MDKSRTAPAPVAAGNCNCVVRIQTSRRIVRGTDLYQECHDHFGHAPGCPSCGWADFPHSAPIGIWGVELSVSGYTLSSPLAGATATEPSRAQDGPQWPGGFPDRKDWNTCTCDTTTHSPNDDNSKYFVPYQEANTTALAAWFQILSNSQTCEPLASQPLTVGFRLDLYELDSIRSDLIYKFEKPGQRFDSLNCDAQSGRCQGKIPIHFITPSTSVEAFGDVSVECLGRPWNQEASSCQCGDGSCCDGEWASCPEDCGWFGGGGGGGECCTCDCDGNGWVGRSECYSGCGGYVSGGYCVTG